MTILPGHPAPVKAALALDYLRALGVDALWLSPHYPSPFLDCGYDITDFTGVGPEYGSLEDFVTLLRAAHARAEKPGPR